MKWTVESLIYLGTSAAAVVFFVIIWVYIREKFIKDANNKDVFLSKINDAGSYNDLYKQGIITTNEMKQIYQFLSKNMYKK